MDQKTRTGSATSQTEYVNEGFEDSESSKDLSIQVTKDTKDELRGAKTLQDFSEISEEKPDLLIPKGFRKMYLAALVVLLFAVCMGKAATYSATATDNMRDPRSSINPTEDEVSWIGSLMPIGALIGGTAGGYFSNSLGRKGTLMFNTLPFVIGWILIAYAETVGMIYVGRLITGFSTGLVSVATPMYLIEISTPEIRGLLGASFQLFVVIGVLIVSSLAAGMNWRWLAVACGIVTLLSAVFMLPMPESPKWLMAKKRRAEAKKALIFLQGESFDAELECQMIEDEIEKQPAGGMKFSEFLEPTVYKPFLLSISLMFFQQFSGINAVLFFTVDIFKGANVPLDPILATIIVAIVQVLATVLCSVLMDKAGRRPLLLISAVFMALSLIIFGGYDLAQNRNPDVVNHFGWLPVLCLTGFIAAFAMGFGPAPWLMVAEMNGVRFRSIVSGTATALNWTFAFFVTFSFKKLEAGIHGYGVYWLYGSFCLLSIVITYFFLPETKGKNQEEIEDFFKRK